MAIGCVVAPPVNAADDESVIVVLRPGINASEKTELLVEDLNVEPDLEFSAALTGFSARVTPATKQELVSDPDVLFVSPDLPVKTTESIGSGAEPSPQDLTP